jgi:hypothetical protein
LNGSPTPQAYLQLDRMTEFSRLSRFGMTFAALTANHGEAVLTSFLEAFPARISVPLEEASGLTESEAASGQRWRGSFARYALDTSSWRTPQCSLLEGLDVFLETWPRWGSMLSGVSYLRRIPELHICESVSGLWQTPVADDAVERTAGKWNSRGEPKLSAEVKLWPTPVAQPANGTPARFLERKREWIAKGSSMGVCLSDLQLAAVASERGMDCRGHLNPEWVEWLMGWPHGWTELKPLETGRYQEWQRQHGIFSTLTTMSAANDNLPKPSNDNTPSS